MSYEDRDPYGMYKSTAGDAIGAERRHGPGPELMGAGTLMGNDVYNNEGVALGHITEIMLDMRSGRIGYGVLSFGGFLGIADKLFAVPWSALKLDTENKRFVLNVNKDRLESAPGFDKECWPNMADEAWARDIHSYYGVELYPSDPRD